MYKSEKYESAALYITILIQNFEIFSNIFLGFLYGIFKIVIHIFILIE